MTVALADGAIAQIEQALAEVGSGASNPATGDALRQWTLAYWPRSHADNATLWAFFLAHEGATLAGALHIAGHDDMRHLVADRLLKALDKFRALRDRLAGRNRAEYLTSWKGL